MQKAWRTGMLTLMAAALSSTTVFFGVGPMMAAYRGAPRALFLGLVCAMTVPLMILGQFSLWVPFLGTAGLVLVFCEDQRRGGSVLRSGVLSCVSVLLAFVVGAGIWVEKTQTDWSPLLKSALHDSIVSLNLTSKLVVDEQALFQQMPSAAVIGVIVALWVGILWERRLRLVFKLPSENLGAGLGLTYRLPDAAVWILIASVAGAFVEMNQPELKVFSLNLFNIMVLLYFFQGLSVVATFFKLNQTGYLWRALGYFFLTVQLFLVVGFLGLLDYWFNFRDKMLRKSMETV